MSKSVIVLAAMVLVLVLPAAAMAVVTIQTDSCVTVGETQTRIYFTASNVDSAYVGIKSFTFIPQTPTSNVVAAGAVMPWVHSLGLNGEVQFMAPPFAPHYYLRTRGGFYITVEGTGGCYDATYYDKTIQQVYSSVVCFSDCFPVGLDVRTWGAVKVLYR